LWPVPGDSEGKHTDFGGTWTKTVGFQAWNSVH
jgi:hypothetical protein